MHLLLCVIVDGVGVVEPAVVGVALLTVHQGEGLAGWLGQLVSVLHLDQVEVAAVSLTGVFLLSSAKRSALNTLLVFGADSWTGRTDLTGRSLKLGVVTFTGAALTVSTPVTDLLISCQTGGGV